MKKLIKMVIFIIIGAFILLAALVGIIGGAESSKENKVIEETKENIKEEISQEKPESNTKEMVDYIISKAYSQVTDLSKEERIKLVNESYDFIQKKVISNKCFEDNETMEKLIYYGAFLEKNYKDESKDNELAKVVRNIGTDTIQMIKYVYRGNETKESESTIENHDQIIKGIKKANEIIKEIN